MEPRSFAKHVLIQASPDAASLRFKSLRRPQYRCAIFLYAPPAYFTFDTCLDIA